MSALAADLFDYAASQAAAQRGMDLTLNSQPVDWIEQYRIHSERFLDQLSPRSTFIGESLRRYVQERAGSPRSANAWGASMRASFTRWREEGRIRVIGMAPMAATSSHARQSPLYEYLGPIEHFPIQDDPTGGAI